jgi:hypothetical protein
LCEAFKSNSTLTSLSLGGNVLVASLSFSFNTGNKFANEGAVILSQALRINTSLTALEVSGNRLVASLFSLNTETNIGDKGAIQFFEALISNVTAKIECS